MQAFATQLFEESPDYEKVALQESYFLRLEI